MGLHGTLLRYCLLLALLVMNAMPELASHAAKAQTDQGEDSTAVDGKTPKGAATKGGTVRMLNKLTLEIAEQKIPIGGEKNFGKIKIKLLACYRRDKSDGEAFLQIWDSGKKRVNPEDPEASLAQKNSAGYFKVFSGWMFASSPSLSALDHPIYDVWLISCD